MGSRTLFFKYHNILIVSKMLSFAEFLIESDHINKNKRFIEYICKQIKKKGS